MTFEDKIKVFYERILETWNDINGFLVNCENLLSVWGFRYSQVETCRLLCNDAKREIEMIKSRLLNRSLKCVIIGKVSSGKSTLLNSLLLHKVLPSGFSCRTNSFIEVKKSHDQRNYIRIADEEKSLDSLKGLADDFSPDALPCGSHIDLFFYPKTNSILNDHIILMDTPGFDDVSELDNIIEEKCSEADVIILVVSSINGLGETERKFIIEHQTIFSKPNVIILYSFWDKPQSENVERSNKMRLRLLDQARNFLDADLRLPRENLEERIFFISAEERLLRVLNEQESVDQLVQGRNDEYDKFLSCLEANMSNNSFSRRLSIVENICETIDAVFAEIEFCIENMTNKESEFGNKLRDDLSILGDFNDKVNAEIDVVLRESYDQFFDKGLEVIRAGVVISEEDIQEKLNVILQELTIVIVESLKIRVRDLVDIKKVNEQKHCLSILEELYFQDYLNLDKQRKCLQIDILHQSFAEINRKKKIGTGLSIAGAVLGAAATFATGGILAGVVLPIPTLFGASVLGATGAAIGGGAGGGLSNALISINREAFGTFYKKEELFIKELWKEMEDHLKDSYKLFLDQISSKVDLLILPLKEEFYTLPNKINFLKSDAIRIKNSF